MAKGSTSKNYVLKKENQAYIIWSQHRRQELIVSDVLHHGADDFACFVEQSSSRPGRVEEVQLHRDPVVFSYPDCMYGTQSYNRIKINMRQ